MARAALRPTIAPAMFPAAGKAMQPLAALSSMRTFSAKPKVEDGTLEGRYATALFMASGDRLDKVYGDLMSIRAMITESPDMKLLVETPGIDPNSKVAAVEAICKTASIDSAIVNFFKVLIENRRLFLLPKMIDLFEVFYRAEKGLVPCVVTSAKDLSKKEKTAVEKAMQKRAGAGTTLLMDFDTNPNVLGGLVVKMGEAVYDYSVSNRLDRMQTQLLAPLA